MAGAFVGAGAFPYAGRSFGDVQIAAFDGDARPDVVALDVLRHEVFSVSTATTGALTPSVRLYAIPAGAQRMIALPVTPAAAVSLAVNFRTGTDAVVYRRDGAALTATGATDTVNSALAGILGGPVTADRCHDLVAWHADGARIDVHPSTCAGGLAPHVALPTYVAAGVTLADVDGDGDRDLIVTHRPPGPRAGYFSVWVNVAR